MSQSSSLMGCAQPASTSAKNWHPQTFSLNYTWGPNGHPAIAGLGGSYQDTLHWDGGSVLFETTSTGALAEIKIEDLAYYVPGATTGVNYIDRNQSGFAEASHWSGGVGPWYPASPYHQLCAAQAQSGGTAFVEPGADGVSDGYNTFQGVRSYDPNIGSWTAPDAYAGEVGDPVSHKAYMWNRNNSYVYQDPSGYCIEDACLGEGIGVGLAWAALGAVAAIAAATNHEAVAKGASAAQSAIGDAIRNGVHAIGTAIRSRLPLAGPPNSTVTRPDGKQVRVYGPDGSPKTDIDYGHAGHHPGIGSPHAHDWDTEGDPSRGPGRPLTPKEQEEHGTVPDSNPESQHAD